MVAAARIADQVQTRDTIVLDLRSTADNASINVNVLRHGRSEREHVAYTYHSDVSQRRL